MLVWYISSMIKNNTYVYTFNSSEAVKRWKESSFLKHSPHDWVTWYDVYSDYFIDNWLRHIESTFVSVTLTSEPCYVWHCNDYDYPFQSKLMPVQPHRHDSHTLKHRTLRPPRGKRHFQTHFRQWKCLNFSTNSTMGSIGNNTSPLDKMTTI